MGRKEPEAHGRERQELGQSEKADHHPPPAPTPHGKGSHSHEEIVQLMQRASIQGNAESGSENEVEGWNGLPPKWKTEVEGVTVFSPKLHGQSNPKSQNVSTSGSTVIAETTKMRW